MLSVREPSTRRIPAARRGHRFVPVPRCCLQNQSTVLATKYIRWEVVRGGQKRSPPYRSRQERVMSRLARLRSRLAEVRSCHRYCSWRNPRDEDFENLRNENRSTQPPDLQ